MKTPISVINFNGSSDTIELIKSLIKSQECFDCIIVDNDSPREDDLDRIISFVESEYGVKTYIDDFKLDTIHFCSRAEVGENSFTFIKANDNYGFSKGTNIGIKYGLSKYPETEFVVILNNDTEVTEGFISKITDQMKKHDLAAAMGTIIYYGYDKPYIWSIGGPISFVSAMGIHLHKGEVYNGCDENTVERHFVSGCFTVFKTEVLKEIGLIDEDYFFGCEEYQYSVDICKKYKMAWVPASLIYHKSKLEEGNGSSHRIADLCWQCNSYMNKIVFINKNKGLLYRFLWHMMFRLYINTKVKKKYLGIEEYGQSGFETLRRWLFGHINDKAFKQEDFLAFKKEYSN